MSVNLYSLLPDTLDAQRAKELTEMQSEVGALKTPQIIFHFYRFGDKLDSKRL